MNLEQSFEAAEALRGRGFFSKAERLYRKVLRGSRGDATLWVQAALGSAAGFRALGQVARASALLKKAETLSVRERWAKPAIELEQVMVLRAAGDYEGSLRRLGALLKSALAGRRFDEAAYLLWAMGGAYRFQGRLAESLRAFERSLALARRIKDPAAAGYALFGMGGAARVMGRLKDSERYYGQAKKAFDKTDDVFGKAYAHCGLANALRQAGRLGEAERLYLKAFFLYKSLQDEVDLAYVDWGLGKIYLQKGELRQAEGRLARSLKAFHRHGEARGEVLALNALAQALHARGETSLAERLFDQAVRLAKSHRIHAHLEVFT